MAELSQKKQELFDLIKEKYNKTVIRKGDIYVYDGSILHIVEEKKKGIKVSSVLNMRHWALLLFLIITGICLSFVGIALTLIVANLILIKSKKAKKAKLTSIIN